MRFARQMAPITHNYFHNKPLVDDLLLFYLHNMLSSVDELPRQIKLFDAFTFADAVQL